MKGCELCPGTARMYCESDEASLCFECDAKVHGANFLVARHSRVLLCRCCQAATPWRAEGPKLGPTVSVCDRCCVAGGRSKKTDDEEGEGDSGERQRIEVDASVDDHDDDGDEIQDDDDDDRESEEEEEGEEQVVPWKEEEEALPVSSSSSSEEEQTSMGRIGNGSSLKRNRHSISHQNQLPCSSSSIGSHLPNRSRAHLDPVRTVGDDEATPDAFRPLKDRKKACIVRSG